MLFFCRMAFLLTLFVSCTLAAPSEIDNYLLSTENYGPRANEVRDSRLERVQVKQETGFDGRVRSIRFNFEPEQDRRDEGIEQRLSSPNSFNFHPIRATYNQNLELPIMRMIQIDEASTIKASRSKRDTGKNVLDNEVDDLETAEAKVFRPLFVYRQQVSRRLKLQNDKRSNQNLRQIRSRATPRFSRYYYPYQYSPARFTNSANRQNHAQPPVEEIDSHQRTNREHEDNILLQFLSNALIYVLETTLSALLSPIFIWQWFSKHSYCLKLLKIVVEVALELLMLIVFAGVSIMTAAVLIYEESCNDAHSKKMILKSRTSDENEEKPWVKQIHSQRTVKSPSQ